MKGLNVNGNVISKSADDLVIIAHAYENASEATIEDEDEEEENQEENLKDAAAKNQLHFEDLEDYPKSFLGFLRDVFKLQPSASNATAAQKLAQFSNFKSNNHEHQYPQQEQKQPNPKEFEDHEQLQNKAYPSFW